MVTAAASVLMMAVIAVDVVSVKVVSSKLWCRHRCQLIADSGLSQLRSAHANVLIVPRTNTQLGYRSFSVAGPRIWKSTHLTAAA